MATETAKIGIVGCGNISNIYFQGGTTFENLEVVACADLFEERAKAKAKEHGVGKALSTEALLADPEVDIVVNLTVPKVHAQIGLAAVENGKHVHGEKPLAVTREDGAKLVALAKEKGLRVGSAPDTFLGGGLQTCRKLIDDGWIGTPVAATAFMTGHGPEGWHPDPEFFYKVGGGPMFDMGPYYLTALVNLLGPVKRVTGSAQISHPQRIIGSEPHKDETIEVEVATHIAGVMDFACGAVGTMVMSFDVWAASLPRIEIYGSEGTLSCPDPNTFGGPVRVKRYHNENWQEVPLSHGYAENSRGIGVADMAAAIQSGRQHRCNGDLAYHVLDLMHAFHDASAQGKHIDVQSTCERPAPLPLNLRQGTIDG